MLELVKGNILDAKVEAVVNTVNTAGVMGRGLALQFKKAFPEIYKAYAAACKRGEVRVGQMFVHEAGGIVLPRYIINFPTKVHWRSQSKLEYIDSGLRALIAEVQWRRIRSIAIPPLGAGLGGLSWSDVKTRIEAAFSSLPEVHVWLYEPAGAPPPAEMKNNTAKPDMTPGRAAVLALMHRYLVPGYDYLLSLLEVQKLAYLLQQAGEPLRLKYEEYLYGPYADNLRHVLNRIEGHYIEGFGDGRNKPDTPLKLLPGAAEAAEQLLSENEETQQRLARVADLIEGYETPFGMELLATVHWAAKKEEAARKYPEKAIDAVHAWNKRKASTMKPEQIAAAWHHLRDMGWL